MEGCCWAIEMLSVYRLFHFSVPFLLLQQPGLYMSLTLNVRDKKENKNGKNKGKKSKKEHCMDVFTEIQWG